MRKDTMKKSYMKVRPTKKNYFNTTWEAEANVDNGGFETTRNLSLIHI